MADALTAPLLRLLPDRGISAEMNRLRVDENDSDYFLFRL
jgi:hypothetical protein